MTLDGKADTRISTSYRFGSENVQVSAGSISEDVSIDSVQESSLPVGLIAAILLALLVVGLFYKRDELEEFMTQPDNDSGDYSP